ncbi:MAG: hypothetical protein WDN26_19595 [Chitinophagaceae bacterium]
MEGYITGDFDIRGELSKLQITGKGRLQDAGFKKSISPNAFIKYRIPSLN